MEHANLNGLQCFNKSNKDSLTKPFGGYMTLRWNITKETIKQNCSIFFILKPLLHQSNSIIQLEICIAFH